MNQTEILKRETTFSFSELRKKVVDLSERKIVEFEKKLIDLPIVKTINNFLKTPEEMDAEFSFEMNTGKLMNKEYTGIFDTYERLVEYKDENNNTYSPDDTPSGFMEENY